MKFTLGDMDDEDCLNFTGYVKTKRRPVQLVTTGAYENDTEILPTLPIPRQPNISDFLRELSDTQAYEFRAVIGVIGLLMILGTIGNFLVLYIHILKFKPSSTRTFVISLAAFDLLCCLIAMPGEILDIRFTYNYTFAASCKIMRFISSFVAIGSGITLMAVSFDRYRRICHPLKRQIGHTQAWYAVMFSSLGSVFCSWPLLFISDLKTVETGYMNITGQECSVSDRFSKTKIPLIYTIFLFIVFMSAFVCMITAYGMIGRAILRQNSFRKRMVSARSRKETVTSILSSSPETNGTRVRKISTTSINKVFVADAGNQGSGDSDSDYNIAMTVETRPLPINRKMSSVTTNQVTRSADDTRLRKTTLMLFIISITFLVSFLPHLILKAVQALDKGFLDGQGLLIKILYNLTVRSFLLNSVSNAFIYGFCSPRFRQECKNMCKRIARKRSFSLNSNSFNYA